MYIKLFVSVCLVACVYAESKPMAALPGKTATDTQKHRAVITDMNKHKIQPRDIKPHFQQGSLSHGFVPQASSATYSTYAAPPSTSYHSPQPHYHHEESSEEEEEEEENEKDYVLFPVPIEVPVYEKQNHHHGVPYSTYPHNHQHSLLPYQIGLSHHGPAAPGFVPSHGLQDLHHGDKTSSPALILLSHLLKARALRPITARELNARLTEDPALLRLALAKTLSDPALPAFARSGHSLGANPLLNKLLPDLGESVLESLYL